MDGDVDLARYPVLAVRLASVAELRRDPRNARVHSRANLDAIRESLEEHGQLKNLVVSADGEVKAGNGTLEAAGELGWSHVVVGPAPVDLVAAKKFAIQDNRSAELAAWDPEVLRSQIEELRADEVDVTNMGWNESEFEGLVSGPTDPFREWDGMPEFSQGDKRAFRSVTFHFVDSNAVEKFEKLVGRKMTNRFVWFPEISIERYADKRYASDEGAAPARTRRAARA